MTLLPPPASTPETGGRVAYFGPPGTHTHQAAISTWGPDVPLLDVPTIAGIFDAVRDGRAQYGIAPIENSTEGGVTFTLDCLIQCNLKIRAETILGIQQCLVGQAQSRQALERVYYHPQALAQCKRWLATSLPDVELVGVAGSTSASAREAARDPHGAAIANALAANLHGLSILARDIQDSPNNATRFIVVGEEDASPTGDDKTSLLFSTAHERGALKKVLELFDQDGINLTRIESRPGHNRLWEYVFFTEVEGHRLTQPLRETLQRLPSRCSHIKVVGSYPRAKAPAPL